MTIHSICAQKSIVKTQYKKPNPPTRNHKNWVKEVLKNIIQTWCVKKIAKYRCLGLNIQYIYVHKVLQNMYEKHSVSLTVSNSNGATGALLKSLTGQSAVSSRKSVTSTCRTSRDVYQIGNRRTGYGVRTTDYCIAVQSTVSSRLLYAYAYYDSLCDIPNPMTPPHHVDV